MINAFRNYALLLVVFIHAHIYFIEYFKMNVPYWLVFIYDNFIGYFHPASILAAISGYLFYKDFANDSDNVKWNHFLKEKYSKRLRSVAVPYIFWVAFFFVINNLLIYGTTLLKPNVFINHYHTISILNFIKALFYPELAIAKHLWYLNNMLFVFALAPLMPFLNRSKSVFVLLLLGIMAFYWLAFSESVTQTQLIIKYRFIIFFIVGAFFALNKQYLSIFVTRKRQFSVICISLMAVMFVINLFIRSYAMLYIINSLVVPVLVFYIAYVLIANLIPDNDTMYNRSSHFLLYIIHPMLLSLFCKLMFFSGLFSFNNYITALLCIVLLSYLVVVTNNFIYHFLHKYFKTFTLKFL